MSIEIPPGSVIITPTAMFEEMRAIHEEVRTLTGKVDPALSDMRTQMVLQDRRLRALENWRWFVLGTSAVMSIVATALAVAIASRVVL